MAVHVKISQEYLTRGSYGFLGVSPSGLFIIIAWPNCPVFRNMRSFYDYCDRMFCILMIDVRRDISERHIAASMIFLNFHMCDGVSSYV